MASDGRLDPALRRLVAVLILGGAMGILDGSMVAVALRSLADRFDSSLSAVGWVSTGYLLALTLTIPVTGWAVDRFGGRRLWLAGLIGFGVASLASAAAWNLSVLIAARVAQGMAAGVLDPLMLVLLARSAGPGRAGRVMGLMGIVGSSGPILGPILGGVILQVLDWRWMFLVNLPIVVIAFVGAARILPTDRAETRAARLDVVGLALLGPGVAAAVLALSQAAEHEGFAHLAVLIPLAVSATLLTGYAVRALRDRAGRGAPPLLDLRLFTRPGFSASVVVAALLGAGTFGSLTALPLYYQLVRGEGASAAGLLLAPLGLGSAIVMPLAGRLSDRLGSRRPILAGGVLAGLATLLLTRVGATTPEWQLAVVTFALGAGLGCVGAPTIGSVYRTLPAALVPQGSTALYMLNQLGASVGVAAVTLVVQTATAALDGFQLAYAGLTGAIAALLGIAALIPGRPAANPADVVEAIDSEALR